MPYSRQGAAVHTHLNWVLFHENAILVGETDSRNHLVENDAHIYTHIYNETHTIHIAQCVQ